MMRLKSSGFTLLELIAAVIISAGVVVIGLTYLLPPGQSSQQHSCDLTRELLQNEANRFQERQGRFPSSNLQELATGEYVGLELPLCPVTGERYRIDRSGVVACPTHEATR